MTSRRKKWIAFSVLAFVVVGAVGYDKWQENKRQQVLEELMAGPGCEVCSARHEGIAKKQKLRREQSLLEELSGQPSKTAD